MYDRRIKRNYIIILVVAIIALFLSTTNTVRFFIDRMRVEKIMDKVNDDVVIVEVNDDIKNVVPINPPSTPSNSDNEEDSLEEPNTPNDYWDYIKIPLMSVNFSQLLEKNKDTVGWVKLEGTNINYPVVQTDNNDYYLNHAFNGSKNYAGWVFMDYRNNATTFDRNTIIYGHGRIDGTMFGSLKNIIKDNWYENTNNYVLKFSTPTENTLWQVFSVYTIEKESYYIKTDFESDDSYMEFLNTISKRSIYTFNANLNKDDKVITLSTCFQDNKHRVVLHAKLIKKETR